MMHKSHYPPGIWFEILPQYLQKGWNFEFFHLYHLSGNGESYFYVFVAQTSAPSHQWHSDFSCLDRWNAFQVECAPFINSSFSYLKCCTFCSMTLNFHTVAHMLVSYACLITINLKLSLKLQWNDFGTPTLMYRSNIIINDFYRIF